MSLNKDILDEFEDITRYPITSFFEKVVLFIQNDHKLIVDYFSGKLKELPTVSFTNFDFLFSEIDKLFGIIQINNSSFSNFKWFLLIEEVEKIHNFLLTTNKISKWLRSSITSRSFSAYTEIEVGLKQSQTLEALSRDLGSRDSENDWVEIAFLNELEEENYTSEGGNILKANTSASIKKLNIKTIVDNLQGDKILGVDIYKKLTYDITEQDLKVLSPKETYKQSINILITLKKGDNPEFSDQGRNEKLTVGSNINSIAYPILFRQMKEVFATDDTIKSFVVTDVNRKQDGLFIEYEVVSRRGDLETLTMNK
jgi:hypothetical protein